MIYRIFNILLLCFCINNTAFASKNKFIFVPFKQAMNSNDSKATNDFQKFESIYDKRNPDNLKSASWPLIPKKIHQIWLYNTAIPLDVTRNIQLWRETYPDWEYKLWLIDDINELDFLTKDLFRKSRSSFDRLNIIKFELLNKFGGVYIDINYVPIQNMSYLNSYYKFYAGILPLTNNNSDIEISTSFIASRQKNLFLHKTLLNIREEWHKQKYYKNFTEDIFNKVVKNNIKDYRRSIIFPASYFNIALLDHPLISFFTKYIFFKETTFYHKIHKETIAAKQRY